MGQWIRRKLIVVAIMVIVAVVIGPFGTYEVFSLSQRIIYWTTAFIGVGFFMEATIILVLTHPALSSVGHYPRLVGAVLFAAVPGTVVIVALENVFREVVPTSDFGLTIWFFVAVIGMLMGLIEYRPGRLRPRRSQPAGSVTTDAQPVPQVMDGPKPGHVFFRRLHPDLGQALVSLSIEDHYLQVVTRAGTQTLLMRIRDAEAELDGYPGLRVHRSHWVAFDSITEMSRSGNKWSILLRDGRILPVSRDVAPRLRAALDAMDRSVEATAPPLRASIPE